jgi:hypothetical protein
MYTILPSSAQCRWLAATFGVPVGPLLATEREEHHTAAVPPRRGKGPLGSQDQHRRWVCSYRTGGTYCGHGGVTWSREGPRCPAHAPVAAAAPYAGDVRTSEMGTCAICYQPMIMHPDQVTHPSCEAVT